MRLALLSGLYVGVVCTAQVAANKIVILPVWHLAAPGGTYAVGLALALIETAHHTARSRREGWLNAQAMIALGFVASALLAGYLALVSHMTPAFPGQEFDRVLGQTWKIVGASLAAFAVSETTDNVLGAWARGRVPDAVRVVGTNLVSTPLDSLVFVVLAFGAGSLNLVKGQFVAKMEATVLLGLPLVYVIRYFMSRAGGAIVTAEAEA
ncbi:MAG: queuosine precursor transporter [Actinomycetota bacterium]